MINGNVGVNLANDKTKELLEALKALSKVDVLVGVPEEESSREGEMITNAELAFIHSEGSPLNNIPARPFIEPAIEDPENSEIIAGELKSAAQSALSGNTEAMSRYLVRAGIQGQNVVRDWFTNSKNNWPENSPLTIARKGSDRPLIDTGELRKSVTYVIREK